MLSPPPPKASSFLRTYRGCGTFHCFGRNGDWTCHGFPKTDEEKMSEEGGAEGEGGLGSGGEGRDRTSSALLLLMWRVLMYYLFTLAPDQTPVVFLAGKGLITYAASAGVADWMEFYLYIRESKFIHTTNLDFTLLSACSVLGLQ